MKPGEALSFGTDDGTDRQRSISFGLDLAHSVQTPRTSCTRPGGQQVHAPFIPRRRSQPAVPFPSRPSRMPSPATYEIQSPHMSRPDRSLRTDAWHCEPAKSGEDASTSRNFVPFLALREGNDES